MEMSARNRASMPTMTSGVEFDCISKFGGGGLGVPLNPDCNGIVLYQLSHAESIAARRQRFKSQGDWK